jgi:hypothetical protein
LKGDNETTIHQLISNENTLFSWAVEEMGEQLRAA